MLDHQELVEYLEYFNQVQKLLNFKITTTLERIIEVMSDAHWTNSFNNDLSPEEAVEYYNNNQRSKYDLIKQLNKLSKGERYDNRKRSSRQSIR